MWKEEQDVAQREKEETEKWKEGKQKQFWDRRHRQRRGIEEQAEDSWREKAEAEMRMEEEAELLQRKKEEAEMWK